MHFITGYIVQSLLYFTLSLHSTDIKAIENVNYTVYDQYILYMLFLVKKVHVHVVILYTKSYMDITNVLYMFHVHHILLCVPCL